MPGYRVYLQDGGEVRESVTCSYCKLVLRDAVQTTETGLRFCKEYYEKVQTDPSYSVELDSKDKVWPDYAVKREVDNLKVKCENNMVGCDWAGLFKDLMKHLDDCQFKAVMCENPGCGKRVLLSQLEVHLKEKCFQRQVECKNCGKKMSFIKLQEHTELCPNAPKVCGNCKKKIPAAQFNQHVTSECKHIKCVCNENDVIYEVGSVQFKLHLEDMRKLADHLEPMITKFSKMFMEFQEMTATNQLLVKRTDELEARNSAVEKNSQQSSEMVRRIDKLEARNSALEKNWKQSSELVKRIDELEARNSALEKNSQQSSELVWRIDELEARNSALEKNAQQSSEKLAILENKLENEIKKLHEKNEAFERQVEIVKKQNAEKNVQIQDSSPNIEEYDSLSPQVEQQQHQPAPVAQSEVVPYTSSESVKQVEDKSLEVALDVLSVHYSGLEQKLQASLASTHNGKFLWRIPEVRQRIHDAKIGRITSIYSPPFYTGRNGYKMCIRAYLNGDGTGEGTHLSIFFVLMRGEYDPLLQWPFEPKVSLILVDQDHKKHLIQTFKPNAQSSSFKRPVSDMNVASGCPEFAELSILDNPNYVKEDVMYIKAIVDTSKIFHP